MSRSLATSLQSDAIPGQTSDQIGSDPEIDVQLSRPMVTLRAAAARREKEEGMLLRLRPPPVFGENTAGLWRSGSVLRNYNEARAADNPTEVSLNNRGLVRCCERLLGEVRAP